MFSNPLGDRKMRVWLFLGALNGMLAVLAGAYGWHSLEGDEASRQIFMLGVDYQMWHALALIGVAWLAERHPGTKLITAAGVLFTAGIVCFSGTLYAFGITTEIPVPYAAPVGGYLLVGGWACILLWVLFNRRQ